MADNSAKKKAADSRKKAGKGSAKKAAPAKKAAAKKAAPAKKAAAKKAAPAKKVAAKKVAQPNAPRSATTPPAVESEALAEALVVGEGETPWSKEELAEVSRELTAEANRLRAELDEAALDLADLLRSSSDVSGDDQADAGTANLEREHELSLTQNARDMLEQVERALSRIENGTYGICEGCGQPIGKARLQVFPRATLCMSCKQLEERR